ncbi:MAG: hypothetical protein J1E37_07845 [Prevotella sp.]|nr:hypothetical protein [Prevotella sp.]
MTKNRFLLAFTVVVVLLAVVRWTFLSPSEPADTPDEKCEQVSHSSVLSDKGKATRRKHRILSVPSYKEAFPDSQSVQIIAAQKWGVRPVRDRKDAEQRMSELVYVGVSPYYHVDRLSSSIPYLVPRAAMLLQDIGQSFYDSLYQKGVPMQQFIVTSVLRSMEDVSRLQRHNGNATENSCHLYGTTFDICYNRYQPIGRRVGDDTLKWVLSEVLRDKRKEGRCYIKYEVKQGCFHMTVR